MSIDNTIEQPAAPDHLSPDSIIIPLAWYDTWLTTATSFEELQVLLAYCRLRGDNSGVGDAIEESVFVTDPRLAEALGPSPVSHTPASRIFRALNQAVTRGALVRSQRVTDNRQEIFYATPGSVATNQESWGSAGDVAAAEPADVMPPGPSIFASYESNIGMLTPLIVDQIELALDLYPAAWIHDAIDEAVAYNRRQWRYIQRILQNWAAEGRPSGVRNEVSHATNKRGPARALDTDQYRGGRHLERARKLQM